MSFQSAIKPITLLMLAGGSSAALASGYHFGTQSVTAQSTANAATAEAADATTIFTNPAGLTKLEENQISASVNLVAPTIKYSNAKAQHIRDGREVSGTDSGKITKDVVPAPHAYGAYKLNDKVTLGLGVYVPFASETEYERTSKLRYSMNQMGLTTIAVEPVVAVKLNEKHSVGVGLVGQYSKAKLRKYADSGLHPQLGQLEAYSDVKGDDWGVGYHLGYMYDMNDKVRLGATYRSKVSHKLRGEAQWKTDLPEPVASLYKPRLDAAGYKASEGASVGITTPESLSLHGRFKVSPQLNTFADVTWTRHSRFDKADLVFENMKTTVNTPAARTANVTQITPNWRNTYRVSLGASYQYSEPLQLRTGVAFDKSPVRSADSRLNTLPDGNRVWFSVGAKYTMNKQHDIDLAYSYVHINDTQFKGTAASGFTTDSKGAASANFKNYASILGVQYTYRFK